MEQPDPGLHDVVPPLVQRFAASFPTYFSLVMATGIVSAAALLLGHARVGWVLLGINLLTYGVLWVAGAIRLVQAPAALWRDMHHHETGPGFLTIVAGTGVLGSEAAAFHLPDRLVVALFAAAIVFWLLFTYSFLAGVTEGRDKPPLEKGLSGSWLLLVVATASLAVLGADVMEVHGAAPALAFFCYFWLVLGWLYYVVLASVIFYRFAFVPMSPREMAGPWWINEGAAAITVLAASKLMLLPGLAIGGFSARALIGPVVVMFWADATFWIPLLVLLFAWKHLIRGRRFRYDTGLWSVVFPLGMYTVATARFQAALGLPFLIPVVHALFWVALIAWAVAFVGMVGRLVVSVR